MIEDPNLAGDAVDELAAKAPRADTATVFYCLSDSIREPRGR